MHQDDLEERILIIEERNNRVTADKAWETSGLRRILITGITYACATILLTIIGDDDAWKHAAVPVVGYILSTFSLPPIKKIWIEQKMEKMKKDSGHG